MRRMPEKSDYSALRSMKELRREREKLRWQINSAEDVLGRDYREVCEMFTFANIVKTVFSSIENIKALIEGVRNGYASVSSMFRKQR